MGGWQWWGYGQLVYRSRLWACSSFLGQAARLTGYTGDCPDSGCGHRHFPSWVGTQSLANLSVSTIWILLVLRSYAFCRPRISGNRCLCHAGRDFLQLFPAHFRCKFAFGSLFQLTSWFSWITPDHLCLLDSVRRHRFVSLSTYISCQSLSDKQPVILVCLSVKAASGRHSANFALTHFDPSGSGWTPGWSFFIGLLPVWLPLSIVHMRIYWHLNQPGRAIWLFLEIHRCKSHFSLAYTFSATGMGMRPLYSHNCVYTDALCSR